MCNQFFIHEAVRYRTDQNQSRICYLNNDGPVQFVGIAAVDVLCVCVCGGGGEKDEECELREILKS